MPHIRKQFSIAGFAALAAAQYAVLLLAFRFLMRRTWERQLEAGVPAIVGCFVAVHLVVCFFEWGFHRYVLHSLTARWLGYFTRGHRNHHGLTPIKLQPVVQGSDRYVLNRYPITEPHQHQDSAFPMYATAAFWVLFTPPLALAQWLLPHLPVLLGGYAAITFSMCLYEILHAIEHRPYEWWKRATEHPRLGRMWRRFYGFHHMHHANIACNEAISGFFGLPVADWCFGTYHQPRELLLEGRVATARDFAVPRPPRWVSAIDAWAQRRETTIHHRTRT